MGNCVRDFSFIVGINDDDIITIYVEPIARYANKLFAIFNVLGFFDYTYYVERKIYYEKILETPSRIPEKNTKLN